MIGTNIASRITNLLFALLFCGHWSLTCFYDRKKCEETDELIVYDRHIYVCIYICHTHRYQALHI